MRHLDLLKTRSTDGFEWEYDWWLRSVVSDWRFPLEVGYIWGKTGDICWNNCGDYNWGIRPGILI